jgi:CheY-like chemotaxis protein
VVLVSRVAGGSRLPSAMPALPPILIVDDDENDLAALVDLVVRANLPNPIEVFNSGDDVIQFLQEWCHAEPRECGRAALLLLDVRMPRVSGFDVLAWIRRHPLLHSLVVVMISHFDEADEAERAVRLGAQSYLHKYPLPITIAALAKLAEHQHV